MQFWSSFWNEWTRLSKSGAPASPQETALSADEKYAYLSEYGTQILCLLDADSGCHYASRNFETITGHGAPPPGSEFFTLLHEDYRARLQALLARLPNEKQPLEFRCKLRHADGQHYWYLLHLHPRRKDAGHVCIAENIHDHMLTQNTLQKAKLEAELALRARSEFLANMSHELRTPLNAVIGFSQLIDTQLLGPIGNARYVDYARHIHESGHDLLAKIEDLLELANIDAGRVTLTREEVQAADILKQVMSAQRHHALAAHVTLETQNAAEPLPLFVDRLKLQHILGHLAANAIRFAGSGSRITLAAEKTAGGECRFTVSDTGCGIAEPRLSGIAAALAEEHCWTNEASRAIGLGLALTREFVALHGGEVAIESKPGNGTRVTILLPQDCIRAPASADYLCQAVS